MNIRRHSLRFSLLLLLSLAMLASGFVISTQAAITDEDYEALGMPVLYVDTEYRKKIKSKESYLDAEFRLVEDGAVLQSGGAKIRGRGNSTWKTIDTAKKPYLLKLDTAEPLLGMARARKWVLFANATDKTFLRNECAFHIARTVFTGTGYVPQERYVTLVVNGRYEGLYCLCEKIEASPDKIFLPDDESFLAEANMHGGEQWDFASPIGVRFSIKEKEGAPDDYYESARARLIEAERVLYSAQLSDEESGWQKYLDAQSFVDWYLINEFARNYDACFRASCYLYYSTRTQKLHMGPIWDFDIAFGNDKSHESYKPEGYIVNTQSWFFLLWQDPRFRELAAARWNERRGQLEAAYGWLCNRAQELQAAADLNDRVWRAFGHRQWPNAPGYRKRKTYQAEVAYMLSYMRARAQWLDSEFN